MKNAVVVTMRVEDMPNGLPGAVKHPCQGGCGKDVWISKATMETVAGAAPSWCMQCVRAALPDAPATRVEDDK